MAENNVIISAEEEAKLLKPIDEYVGKIQAQIDALRVEGSDKVNSLKNQIAIAKENKNLTKEQQNKIIEESKKQLEKATATEAASPYQYPGQRSGRRRNAIRARAAPGAPAPAAGWI